MLFVLFYITMPVENLLSPSDFIHDIPVSLNVVFDDGFGNKALTGRLSLASNDSLYSYIEGSKDILAP